MATTTAGFDVQFIEAIAYALNRNVVLPDNYYNVMTPIQRQQAVSIAGLAQTNFSLTKPITCLICSVYCRACTD